MRKALHKVRAGLHEARKALHKARTGRYDNRAQVHGRQMGGVLVPTSTPHQGLRRSLIARSRWRQRPNIETAKQTFTV